MIDNEGTFKYEIDDTDVSEKSNTVIEKAWERYADKTTIYNNKSASNTSTFNITNSNMTKTDLDSKDAKNEEK